MSQVPPAFKALRYTATATDSVDGQPSITITTDGIDRHGDRVMPDGADLAKYLKNPIVCFGHNYQELPIGTCTSVASTANGLTATWRWLEGDPFAMRVKNAWEQGVLRAASIGFQPLKWYFDEKRNGFDFTQWELLEFSLVPIPANADAVRTLKAIIEPEPEPEPVIEKAGARHSKGDMALIQKAHDVICELGGMCQKDDADPDAEPVDDGKALRAELATLKSQMAALMAREPTADEDDMVLRLSDEPNLTLTPDDWKALVTELVTASTASLRDTVDLAFRHAAGRID